MEKMTWVLLITTPTFNDYNVWKVYGFTGWKSIISSPVGILKTKFIQYNNIFALFSIILISEKIFCCYKAIMITNRERKSLLYNYNYIHAGRMKSIALAFPLVIKSLKTAGNADYCYFENAISCVYSYPSNFKP